MGLSLHYPFLQALLLTILLTSVHIVTCNQFQQLPFSNETLLSGEPDYFGRNEISSGGDLSHYSSASLY